MLTGEGEYCEGSAGAELILDGSETEVDYELYMDDVTTGIIEPGTGSAINFGYHTDEGIYTVLAYTESCSEGMMGQVWVHMVNLPGQAAVPQGPESACNDTSSLYITAGATEASSYNWTLFPSEAGIVTPDMLEATVEWNGEFSGSAYLKVQGENGCGAGIFSDSIEVLVSEAPEPAISGLTLVCEGDMINYQTMANAGSSYSWVVTGGTIQSGSGTHSITVLWGDPGTGYITVTEENEQGCTMTTDPYEVIIDECTGINEVTGDDFSIYPNPVQNTLNISVKREGLNIQELAIYNMLGNEVLRMEKTLSKTIFFNTSELDHGLYVLMIRTSGRVMTYKFEKVH
jgi:hypothetical protein